MLPWLADYEHIWGPLRLLRFITFRVLLAGAILLAAASAHVSGQQPEESPVSSEPTSTETVQAMLEARNCRAAGVAMDKWEKKYRLQDWKIELVCGVPAFMEGKPGVHGITQWNSQQRSATVWINPKSPFPPERIVIHELAHILLGEVRETQSPLIEERITWLLGDIIWDGESHRRK